MQGRVIHEAPAAWHVERIALRPVYRAMRLDQLSPYADAKNAYRIVIETSRGSRNKYSYDPENRVFLLKKVLPEGHVFPFDFGFIPRTKGADGDPLDVLVIMDEPAFAGCVVECRLIGIIEAKQGKHGRMLRNDRFIAVAENSIEYRRYRDIRDVEREMIEQIDHFFRSYNEMAGKKFKVLRILGAKDAKKAVKIIDPRKD